MAETVALTVVGNLISRGIERAIWEDAISDQPARVVAAVGFSAGTSTANAVSSVKENVTVNLSPAPVIFTAPSISVFLTEPTA